MNVKNIAIIGVIALVVIGCVLAAGCTVTTTDTKTTTNPDGTSTTVTTTSTNGQTTTVVRAESDDGIFVGTWGDKEVNPKDNELVKFIVNSDKTGIRERFGNDGNKLEENPFTWEKSDNGIVLTINISDGTKKTLSLKLSDDKKSLIDTAGNILSKFSS